MKGTIISNLLKASAELMALVSVNNIFPYVASEDTMLPLIIYTIDAIDPTYTKDGWANDICDFSVICFSKEYGNLQEIVSEARKALELKFVTGTKRIILVGQAEGYNINEDVYMNKMNFRVEITNN